MRILFIAGSGLGGSNLSLKNLLIGLKECGVSIGLVVPNNKTANVFSDVCTPIVISYRDHAWPSLESSIDYLLFLPRAIFYAFQNIFAFFKLCKVVKEKKPDFIHTNTSVVKIGFQVAKYLKIKHIWHVREYIDEDFNINPFPTLKKHRTLLKNNYTISISKDIYNHFDFDEKSTLIYNGIFNYTSKPMISANKSEDFLYVGSITEKKGVNILIEAFLDYCKKGGKSNLKIVGDGPAHYIQNIKSSINESPFSGRLEFLGRRSDVANLMSESKCLIVTSFREAFGRITAEAMVNGCLVVGRNTGGTKEQFDLGLSKLGEEIGLRFNNAEELTEILLLLDKNKDSFSRMTEKAQDIAYEMYSLQNNALSIKTLYESLISL